MWAAIRDKVIVAILTAVVLGTLTLAWNWASKGGVVRALGGLTADDLAYLQQPHDAGVPRGAVMAFDLADGCPVGWVAFREAQSRVVIGADTGKGFAPGLEEDGAGGSLRGLKYRDHGGGWPVVASATPRPATIPYLALYYCKKG